MKGVGKTKSRSRKPQERKGRTVFAEQFCEAKTAQGFLLKERELVGKERNEGGDESEGNTDRNGNEPPCTCGHDRSADVEAP